WEWVVAGSGLPGIHAAPRGDPHADEEAPWWGADPGARPGQPGTPPAAAADRACQQQRQAVSHGERPDAPVETGCPRSGDGALLCPAQFPGAPEPVAAHDLIGINSGEQTLRPILMHVPTRVFLLGMIDDLVPI